MLSYSDVKLPGDNGTAGQGIKACQEEVVLCSLLSSTGYENFLQYMQNS